MRPKTSARSAENKTNKRKPNPVPGYTGEREQQGLCVYYKQDFFVPTCCCYLARGPPSVPSMLRAPMFTLDMGSCESDASSEDWCWRGCRRLLAEAICRTCLSYRSGVSGMTDNRNRRGPTTIPSQSKADSVLFDCCLFYPFAHASGECPPVFTEHCVETIRATADDTSNTSDSTSWLLCVTSAEKPLAAQRREKLTQSTA